jgi:hypothetical protein
VSSLAFASRLRTRRSLKRVSTQSGLRAVISIVVLLKLAAIAGSSAGAEAGSSRPVRGIKRVSSSVWRHRRRQGRLIAPFRRMGRGSSHGGMCLR